MSISHNHIKVADTIVYDIEMIHVKALSLHCNIWDYDTKKLKAHELTPQPTFKLYPIGTIQRALL